MLTHPPPTHPDHFSFPRFLDFDLPSPQRILHCLYSTWLDCLIFSFPVWLEDHPCLVEWEEKRLFQVDRTRDFEMETAKSFPLPIVSVPLFSPHLTLKNRSPRLTFDAMSLSFPLDLSSIVLFPFGNLLFHVCTLRIFEEGILCYSPSSQSLSQVFASRNHSESLWRGWMSSPFQEDMFAESVYFSVKGRRRR